MGGAESAILLYWLGQICFFGGCKKQIWGVQKQKKQILLPPKEQKSKNAYGGSKKQIKQKSKICYFAILLFGLFHSPRAKKQKSKCFPVRICYFAILLFCLFCYPRAKSKKANAFLFQCAQCDDFESSPTEYKGIPKEIQRLSQQNEVSLKQCK
jgi:hypothetical protein